MLIIGDVFKINLKGNFSLIKRTGYGLDLEL